MKRLQWIIAVFALALTLPMAYVVVKTYQGLGREENARMRYFAETLFQEMESGLAAIVEREERRALDAYHHTTTLTGSDDALQVSSPLSLPPSEPFILGYLQNNPDGSFQTPLVANLDQVPPSQQALVRQLESVNRIFNQKKRTTDRPAPARKPPAPIIAEKKKKEGFADQFLQSKSSGWGRERLGRKTQRKEEISVRQAYNVAQQDLNPKLEQQQVGSLSKGNALSRAEESVDAAPDAYRYSANARGAATVQGETASMRQGEIRAPAAPARFQAEIAPLQSVFIDNEKVFVFRRVLIDNRIYRQGFVVRLHPLLAHLTQRYYVSQPMARFTKIQLTATDGGRRQNGIEAGAAIGAVRFSMPHVFPAPFDFLRGKLAADTIPSLAARRTVNIMTVVLALVLLFGLAAIYRSAGALEDLAERRARFVSSVTHELKTPLTNIRMYIEMLEQGMARDIEQEQSYLRILGSEGARLGRLINNVLELSRLEKKRRTFQPMEGTFEEVLVEVDAVMAETLRREGFTLVIDNRLSAPFAYDREVMIQILINLVENSVKFGRKAAVKEIAITVAHEDDGVRLSVADTGPGIPKAALGKVFDDFFRVEDPLTATTNGTGIGLALVKKFAAAMGGRATARNNDGPGCTISLWLPQR